MGINELYDRLDKEQAKLDEELKKDNPDPEKIKEIEAEMQELRIFIHRQEEYQAGIL